MKSIGILILAYLGINLLLWGGQKLYHMGTEREITANELKLSELKGKVSAAESVAQSLESERNQYESRLESLQIRLKEFEKLAGGRKTLPTKLYRDYEKVRNEHNDVVDLYNAANEKYDKEYDQYQALRTEHNTLVDQTNAKIEAVHYWYLIPIPLPKRALH
jgi:chromosome segregation ATPase